MTADSSEKAQGAERVVPQRKVWVTPTIEEAEASEVTKAKTRGTLESSFTKATS